MKILSKMLLVLLIAVCTAVVVPNSTSMATSATDAINNIQPSTSDQASVEGLTRVVNRVLGFLQIASGLMAVLMIAVTGFKYIVETPDMKAELKKSMLPIIIGVILVFFATSLARFVIGLFS